MSPKNLFNAKQLATKIIIMATFSLFMLIPLAMIRSLICDREETRQSAIHDVQNSYAGIQRIFPPVLDSKVLQKEDDSNKSFSITYTDKCQSTDLAADVKTDKIHRSIYDIITYFSTINISGEIKISENIFNAELNTFKLGISDYKGLCGFSELQFGAKQYQLTKDEDFLTSKVQLPDSAKIGDIIKYQLSINIKGTNSFEFVPVAKETSLTISSTYPHPSFHGSILPTQRDVRNDGFSASWKVLDINMNPEYDYIGVEFINPANHYQQADRSVKYGIMIIILVFVAGIFVEYVTRREINYIQYIVIGLSLVLFYSLLTAFSEFIVFGIAYLIAATMTIIALTLYFRAILKSRSAYMLGGFVSIVYLLNYMLLQMETFSLLAGSLILFAVLCVVMYLTANTKKPITDDSDD